mmetsp:Transcript_6707/g.12548  ORF Transcript_6707/g.12548 Transcript_6707/m.12548 type:complete len:394 (+) Transcript_6707:694-1875(+)|eukprot:CAMPEP_0114243852 /NCGR_PEP_ID=MMETSP0058-20121206/11016_1 /TAXON_ID=36894 /ORGANISM="Pyramimonas parkeae, CCMP726" /LENGTH=393 /DNA_ID=CAMNT_0001356731 /DNA_START=664 /DNA_END=1845 /DNA_ORIENTATION=+
MPSKQVDFSGADMLGGFHVFEKSVDLSVEPDADESSEASLEANDEMQVNIDTASPLPKARSKRRLSCTNIDASERGGFWEYQLDSLEDPEEPLEEIPARRANLQAPKSAGMERDMLAMPAQSCFPVEPSTPQQQQRNMGWDTVTAQQRNGSLPLLQREDEGIVHAGLSGEVGKAHDDHFQHLNSNHKPEDFISSHTNSSSNNQDDGVNTTILRRHHLHKSRKSGSKSHRKSDKEFHVTPLLTPVEEIVQEDEGLMRFHMNNRECPGGMKTEYDDMKKAIKEQCEGPNDEEVGKCHLKREEASLFAADADRASHDASVGPPEEQDKAALEPDVSRLEQMENNETFFFADESLGWYGIGYGSYVNDRPETRKRVEFYTILYFRGIIEAVPQMGGI